jgi:GTP-binding protein
MNLFVLIDLRLEPQKTDQEFLFKLGESQVPFVIIFTKADKLTKNQVKSNLASYNRFLKNHWEDLPPVFVSSAETGMGKEEILGFISETNKLFKLSFQ